MYENKPAKLISNSFETETQTSPPNSQEPGNLAEQTDFKYKKHKQETISQKETLNQSPKLNLENKSTNYLRFSFLIIFVVSLTFLTIFVFAKRKRKQKKYYF